MTPAELKAGLTDLYGTTPEADRAVRRIAAVADCPASRRKVLAAVETGLAIAEHMAAVAAVQKRGEGESA